MDLDIFHLLSGIITYVCYYNWNTFSVLDNSGRHPLYLHLNHCVINSVAIEINLQQNIYYRLHIYTYNWRTFCGAIGLTDIPINPYPRHEIDQQLF